MRHWPSASTSVNVFCHCCPPPPAGSGVYVPSAPSRPLWVPLTVTRVLLSLELSGTAKSIRGSCWRIATVLSDHLLCSPGVRNRCALRGSSGSPTFALRNSLTISRASAPGCGVTNGCPAAEGPPSAGWITSGEDDDGTPEHADTTIATAAAPTATPRRRRIADRGIIADRPDLRRTPKAPAAAARTTASGRRDAAPSTGTGHRRRAHPTPAAIPRAAAHPRD